MRSPHLHVGKSSTQWCKTSSPSWVKLTVPTLLSRYWQRWAQVSLLLGLTCLSACAATEAQSTSEKKEKRPIPVVASTAIRKTVPILVRTTGTAKAYSTVSVKSQVAGLLTSVYFREGQDVKKGELLFKIDSRPLQAALKQAMANRVKAVSQVNQAKAQLNQAEAQVSQAKANVGKDRAQAKNADVQARRYTNLVKQGVVSREQADEFRTTADTQRAVVTASQSNVVNAIAAVDSARANTANAQAAVSAADAEVDSAKVQLSYASIYAPGDGRLGQLNVNQGNLVKDNDTTPLVVISQIRPIYVEFSIPQRRLSELKKYQAQGSLQVEAKPSQDSGEPARGKLVFIDSGVDTTTGTIKLKASFPNANTRLTPGQFVNVVLKLTEEPNAIVVPAPAVQIGQKGTFVYVIKPDNRVEMRPVTVAQTLDNQAVIKTGLQLGEHVVVDGQFNLAPGAVVQNKEAGEKKTGI